MTFADPRARALSPFALILFTTVVTMVGCTAAPPTGDAGADGNSNETGVPTDGNGGDGGDGGVGDGSGGSDGSTTTCVVNPTLIAARRRCLTDDHCPCGAHCEYGRCEATCGAGLPACAAGQRCDRFGRCRAMADQTLVPATVPGATSRIMVNNPSVVLGPMGEQAPIVIRLQDNPEARVRVVASTGFQVQCPGGSFGTECNVMNPPMGMPVTLAVRKDPAAPMAMMTQPGQVQVYGDSEYTSITIQPLSSDAPAMRPLEGVYTGVASLIQVQSDAMATGAPPPFRTEIPVSIRIFPGAAMRVIELNDPVRALTSSATWVGTATGISATSVPWTLAQRRMVSVTPMANATANISVRPATGTTIAVNPTTGSLSGQLSLALDGVHPRRTPIYTWRLILNRSSDLPMGAVAPAVSPAEAPSNSMTLTSTALAAETAINNSVPTWPGGRTQTDFEQLLASNGEVAGRPRRFDACVGSPQIPQTNWNTIATNEWTSPTRMFAAGTTKQSIAAMLTNRDSPLEVLIAPYLNTDQVSSLSITGWTPANLAVPNSNGVVCAVNFGAQNATTCGLMAPRVENYGVLDRCDELSASLGCVPEAVVGGASVRLDGRLTAQQGAGAACTAALSLTGTVTRICRLRQPTPAQCAESLACQDSSVASVTNGFGGAALGAVQAVAGDLACGNRSVAIDATNRREAGAVPMNDLIGSCLTELGRLQMALPAGAMNSTAFASLLRAGGAMPGQCIEPIRHIGALSLASSADRSIALGMAALPDPRATRFALRLWQQWFALHSMIAGEAKQQLTIDPSARGVNPSQDFFPGEEAAVRQAVAGFALALHPRFGASLWEVSPTLLINPDYRIGRVAMIPNNRNHQQTVGLPVVIADLMRAQLGLLEVAVEKATFRTERTYLDGSAMMPDPLIGSTYRTVLAMLPLYMELSQRARANAGGGGLSWAQLADRSDGLLAHAFVSTQGKVEIMRQGRNPLGIEDNDLPLYFRGDPTGADARFSAVSSYLIGMTPMSSGWATAAIAEARTAVNDVANAYRTIAQHEYMSSLNMMQLNTRLDEIRRNYGSQVANLCGTPAAITDTVDVLGQWEAVTGQPFSAESCYRAEGAECGVDAQVRNVPVPLDDIKFALCKVRELNRITNNVLTAPDTDFNAAITGGAPDPMSCNAILAACPGATSADERCLTCGATTLRVNLETLRVLTRFSHSDPDTVTQVTRACRRAFPNAADELPTPSNLTVDPTTIARCYRVRGSLGELSMGIAQTTTDIDIARSEYAARQEAYDLAMNSCILQLNGDQLVNDTMRSHEATMSRLRNTKLGLDIGSHIASAAKDCFSAMQGVGDTPKPWLIAGAIGGCASSVLENGLTIGSDTVQRNMDRAEANHQIVVQGLMADTTFRVCANNAAQELVGARTAALGIQRAMQDLNQAVYKMQQGIENASAAWSEGQVVLQTTRDRAVRAPELDVWVEAAVNRYRDAFRRAKRFTYLAMRAVEYEYQVTMSNRRLVLGATRVEDLELAMSGLRATTLAARINGNPPSSTRAVVSLREHLLQLHSTATLSESEQRLSEVERFHLILQNPRFAVFRQNGQWAGQRIPFSLAPLQTLGLGNASDVPIFASNSCAERIWSVNAMVEGPAESVYRGSVAAFTAIDLEKTNTFFSQWCTEMRAPDNTLLFQSASVRPAVNLFRDPEVGAQDLGGGMVVGGAQNVANGLQNTSTARMQPRINVARNQFAMDDFGSGSSSELAGRGLFGKYALFIPAESISRLQPDMTLSNGLNLDAVTDILLRIDYVSVARAR